MYTHLAVNFQLFNARHGAGAVVPVPLRRCCYRLRLWVPESRTAVALERDVGTGPWAVATSQNLRRAASRRRGRRVEQGVESRWLSSSAVSTNVKGALTSKSES